MNIGSVGSVYGAYSSPSAQPVQSVAKSSSDSDGDVDGSRAQAVSSPPAQTVNTNGQKVGQVINVTA